MGNDRHSGNFRLLPARPARAGLLAFFAVLSFIEVGSGVVVGEAWRQYHGHLVLSPQDLWQLDQLLGRLRVLEGVVAIGAAASTLVWSFLVVQNTALVSRRRRTGYYAVAAWVFTPVAMVALSKVGAAGRPAPVQIGLLTVQAAVLAVPFMVISSASARVGGHRGPFLRWYVAIMLAFVVHHVFTGTLNLMDPGPGVDLGRSALLYLVNGLIMGITVVMAGEAARSMQEATADRAALLTQFHDAAVARFRDNITAEHRAMLQEIAFSRKS